MVFDAATFLPECAASPPPAFAGYIAPSQFTAVRWSTLPAPTPSSRARGARRFGIAFERRVVDVLEAIYGRVAFRASPVIAYRDRSGRGRLAIPDGILRLGDEVAIIEVKARHTSAVWPQLMELYLPLVTSLIRAEGPPRRRVRTVEVCWSYDPGVLLPGPHTLIDSLHVPGEALEVLRWRI